MRLLQFCERSKLGLKLLHAARCISIGSIASGWFCYRAAVTIFLFLLLGKLELLLQGRALGRKLFILRLQCCDSSGRFFRQRRGGRTAVLRCGQAAIGRCGWRLPCGVLELLLQRSDLCLCLQLQPAHFALLSGEW